MICKPDTRWLVYQHLCRAWHVVGRPLTVVYCLIAFLFGTYHGLIRWVETLPDPTPSVASTPMPDAAAWLIEPGDPPHAGSATSTRQQLTVPR